MSEFMRGAVATCCLIAGGFFLRYFTLSRDRLFLLFCVAFWLFGVNWTVLALGGPLAEHAYLIRFLTFLLIAIGIIDKNRRTG